MDYTMARAAEAVGTSKSAIHRAIKAGRLSATKQEDGTYRIDGAELARVYPPSRPVTLEPSPWDASIRPGIQDKASSETPRDGSETAIETRIEVEVLRTRLEAAEAQIVREREVAETQLNRERETVDDLRRRLDRAEERVLALSAQVAQPASQQAQERPNEVQAMPEPPKVSRGFLARLLGL